MTDTSFALYCVCVSNFFFPFTTIILTAITGIFSINCIHYRKHQRWVKKKQVLHFPAYKFTENVLEKRLEMAFLKPYCKFKNFLGEHAPRPPPPLQVGPPLALQRFSPHEYTFKVSRYAPWSLITGKQSNNEFNSLPTYCISPATLNLRKQ